MFFDNLQLTVMQNDYSLYNNELHQKEEPLRWHSLHSEWELYPTYSLVELSSDSIEDEE
jgi:hypothetical protein